MSVMQHFQLDRAHTPEEEPLYQFGNVSGSAPGSYERIKSPGGIWSADDSGRSGLLGRFDEWWYSMSPSKRQATKKTALGALAVGVLVLAIVLVALISSASSKSRDQEQSFTAASPPPAQDSESDATATPPASTASPPPTSSPPPVDLSPPSQSPTAVPDGALSPPALAPPTTATSPPPPVSAPPEASPSQDANDFCSWEDLYLPKSVIPVRYDLNLSVYLDHMAGTAQAADNRVEGTVAIRVRLPFDTRCVLMHMDRHVIKVNSYLWRSAEGQEIQGLGPDGVSFMEEAVQASFQFQDLLPASPSNTDPMTKDGASDEATLGQIIINFTYNLTAGLDGFYTSTYSEADGSQHVMASTQFESTAARKALPLFDEPHFKARFALTLAALPDYTVLSNMPLDSLGDVRADGLQERKFMVSPPMSSYLMAWVVGVLGNVTNPTCATQTSLDTQAVTVPITVYSTLSKVSLLNDSLSAACAAVQRFVATLGVPYPLPKLDLVGIPEFAAGAMENWGLITYKETYLLVDPAPTDVHQLIDVGTVVAHEISHQWFGNLVTCADWTELWLNEGFATYFENVGADAWRPGYGFLQAFFFTVATMPALVEDAVNSTHPLSSLKQVANLTEIDNYFDGISYEKGGAVLRMLRFYMSVAVSGGADFITVGAVPNTAVPALGQVTPLAFSSANLTYLPLRRRLAEAPTTVKPRNRKLLDHEPGHVEELNFTTYSRPTWKDEPLFAALKTYLERKQYGVATAEELWKVLGEVTGLPVSTWMASWTYDSNYPVVHVDSVTTSQVPDPATPGTTITRATVTVHQAPMLASRKCGVAVAVAQGDNSGPYRVGKWWLPITAALQADGASNQVQVVTLNDCTASFSLDMGGSPDAPILLNIGRYGFYRVNYTEEGWRQASDAAENTDVVSAMDMAGLLSDSYRLNEKQQLDLLPFMNLIQSLGMRATAEYGPWAVALAKLRRMRLLLTNAAAEIEKTYLSCIDQLNTFMIVNVTQPFITGQDPELDFDVSPDDPVELRLIRPMILTASGMAEDHTTLKEAQKLMKKIEYAVSNNQGVAGSGVHPDVREAVYCLNMRAEKNKKKGEKAFHDTKKLYIEAAGDPVERDRLLYALTCGQHKSVHQDLLQFLITPDVRIQDVGSTLLALGSQGGSAFEAVWDFMFNPDEFDQLVNRWPSRPSATYSLGLPIKQLAALFPDNTRDADMATFFETYQDMLDPTFLEWYKEHTASNVAWFKTTAEELCTYLDDAR